jgi:hypothetical protein
MVNVADSAGNINPRGAEFCAHGTGQRRHLLRAQELATRVAACSNKPARRAEKCGKQLMLK